MHNYKKVEQALFRWGKWRQSIIALWIEWAKCPDKLNESTFLRRLKVKSRPELAKLCFPDNSRLELYWICCITSDYYLDYPTTFKGIRIPPWLPPQFGSYPQIEQRVRIYPPPIFHEGHERQAFKRYGTIGLSMLNADRRGMRLFGIKEEDWPSVFLPSHHELHKVLNELKGAPKTFGKRGRPPDNSDRLAVMCAAWKDRQHMQDEDIERKVDMELQDKVTRQGQVADLNHLIKRGRKLISDSS